MGEGTGKVLVPRKVANSSQAWGRSWAPRNWMEGALSALLRCGGPAWARSQPAGCQAEVVRWRHRVLGAWSGGRPGRRRELPGSGAPAKAGAVGSGPPSLPAPCGTLRLCRERPASGRCSRGGGRGRGGEREPTTKLGSLRPRLDLNDRSRRPRSAADTREPVPPTARRAAAGRKDAGGRGAEGPRATQAAPGQPSLTFHRAPTAPAAIRKGRGIPTRPVDPA